MKTLKELADIGAAAFADNRRYHYMSVSKQSHSWESDEPARQAFAAAVRDAVLAELATTSDSSPTSKTVPLDMGDIRATDEFQPCGEARQLCTLRHANENGLSLFMLNGMYNLTYDTLATNYLRRQHGSNEWKPCTKEISANQH